MKKEQVQKILQENNIKVKKHYGQNFLIDQDVLLKMKKAINIDEDTYVLEIGPGLGFLTDYLSQYAKKVLCYEIDEDMVKVLKQKNYPNVTIICDDFLKRNLDKDISDYLDNQKIVIVANLPYYITTPILLKILEETSKVSRMLLMMQYEVACRICGMPLTKDYNALSVLVQYYTSPKMLFKVLPTSFIPIPGVDSAVVELTYKNSLYYLLDQTFFLQFNRNIFSQRRKTILNNIKKHYDIKTDVILEVLKSNNLDPSLRAEALKVEDIVLLANAFYKLSIKNN